MKHGPALAPLLAALFLTLSACDEGAETPLAPELDPALTTVGANAAQQCDPGTFKRTAEQVLEDHRAALAAGNLDAVSCNYASDAVVIGDGGIDTGHDQIRSSLRFFLAIFDGTQPQVVQQVVVATTGREEVVRLLFTIDTPCIVVPDGIDTYVIKRGQIHSQTSHGFPIFQCF